MTRIVYAFCYMAIEREGRAPKIINAEWTGDNDWPVGAEWIGRRLGTDIALKIRRAGLEGEDDSER